MSRGKPDPVDVKIGGLIRARRMQLGISQSTLGARCGGISFQQVQKYEKGTNRVSGSRMVQIAGALSTTVAALHGEDATVARIAGYDKLDLDIARETATLNADQRAAVLRVIRAIASANPAAAAAA